MLSQLVSMTPQEILQKQRVISKTLCEGCCSGDSLQLLSFVIKRIKVSDFVRIYACLTQLRGVEVRVLP